MTKEYIENILVEYGVSFTDNLAERLFKEFMEDGGTIPATNIKEGDMRPIEGQRGGR